MKIGDFEFESSSDRDALIEQVRLLNDHRSDYPRDKTVHQVFQETARRWPGAVAVVDGSESWTFQELDSASNRMARFLLTRSFPSGSIVGFMLDHTYDICVTLLGILKAGYAYLPIDHDAPYQRARYMLDDSRARALVSSRRHLRLLNRLQWDCPCLDTVACLDIDDFFAQVEPQGEKMQQEMWDYVGEEMFDDISGGGWKSSYTGEWLSRKVMDEYGENIHRKLSPLLTPETRILDIGCSSGISMFRLAPHVGYYLGTDLSPKILEKSERERVQRGLDNVNLRAVPAHEIAALGEAEFDIVVINSVAQCFSGHNYLRAVLHSAIAMMKPQGSLFLGNLFDRDLQDRFLDSLDEYKRGHRSENVRTKTDYSEELFINRMFLDDLRFDLPQIVEIEYSELLGHEASELREYTFDAILRIDKKATVQEQDGSRSKYQFPRSAIEAHAAEPVDVRGTAEGLAYVMYTSGTTGRPKGVMVPHRAINRLVINTNFIQIDTEDRILQTGALGFDASTFELWGALLNGGSLSRPPEKSLLDVGEMKRLIREQGTTTLWLTSSLFNQFVDLDISVFEGLRNLLVGGERLSPHHINQVRVRYPELTIINGYGPTENTTFTACHRIEKTYAGDIPVGTPVANTEVWILSEAQDVVPVGTVGEICAGGDGLALGYMNDPELTTQKFIRHPFKPAERLYRTGDLGRWHADGIIEYLGRVDGQLKVRGHRIEPGEIEAQIGCCQGVKQAVVTARDVGDGINTLVGYVTGASAIDVDQVREEIRQVLPEYMIPSYVVTLDQFPLTPNGKVDRHRLPDPDTSGDRRPGRQLPLEGRLEEELGLIWKEILGVRDIGATESFFDAGGHSLKVTKMVSSIQQRLGIQIPLAVAFKAPTIRELAAALVNFATFGVREVDQILVPLGPSSSGPPLFAFPPGTGDVLSYVQLADRLANFQLYAFQFIPAQTRISDYADYVQSVDPHGPYLFLGYSYGGNLAFHVAQEMEKRGKRIRTIIMVDSSRKMAKFSYPAGEAERVAREFMGHENLRAYFTNELLREKVCRQIAAYYRYSEQKVETGTVHADLHVILSENAVTEYRDEKGLVVTDTFKWKELTAGAFETHSGFGTHNQMLYEPALAQNAEIIKSLLADSAAQTG